MMGMSMVLGKLGRKKKVPLAKASWWGNAMDCEDQQSWF